MAAAQSYPDRPVRMIMPYAPGGSLDVVARPLSQRFQEVTGQPMVIEHRAGANGMIAADLVAKSRPDGYTLLMASAGPITIMPAFGQPMAYNPRVDLVPVSYLVNIPFTLFSAASFPPRDLPSILAAARENPGNIPFGLPGTGSIGHLAQAMLAQATNTSWLTIPYRGAGQVLPDMLGGRIALTFTTIASAKPMVDAGNLRAIAVASQTRTSAMPDLPTFAELGLPQVEAPLWIGVMAPNGTPSAIIERLHALFADAMQMPQMRSMMATVGADILAEGPEGFAALLRADYPRWAEVVRRGNITLD